MDPIISKVALGYAIFLLIAFMVADGIWGGRG